MRFQVHALPYAPFQPLFAMDDAQLAARRAVRLRADGSGYPCRVSLADARDGDRVILLNHTHLDADSPYRSNHAIFVREHAAQAFPEPGEMPESIRKRVISIRAFDARRFMRRAEVADGGGSCEVITEMLDDPLVDFLHLHFAGPGCFAARVTRT